MQFSTTVQLPGSSPPQFQANSYSGSRLPFPQVQRGIRTSPKAGLACARAQPRTGSGAQAELFSLGSGCMNYAEQESSHLHLSSLLQATEPVTVSTEECCRWNRGPLRVLPLSPKPPSQTTSVHSGRGSEGRPSGQVTLPR